MAGGNTVGAQSTAPGGAVLERTWREGSELGNRLRTLTLSCLAWQGDHTREARLQRATSEIY